MLRFSEALRKFDKSKIGLTLAMINENPEDLLEIKYHPYIDNYDEDNLDENIPELVSWNITNWEWYFLEIKLNFTRPLTISGKVAQQDKISIRFVDNGMFMAIKDGFTLEEQYVTLPSVLSPQYASEDDAAIIKQRKLIT